MSPENVDKHRAYLSSNNVVVDRIVSAHDTGMRISGTPTLIVVDRNAGVLGSFLGQLSKAQEREVLSMITK